MESTRPIRALMRGLDALAVLNLRGGATVSEVAQEIRLPRTTVYRILETLCGAGYVFRDPSDDRYRLTVLIRGLADGFDDEAWLAQFSKPMVYALARELGSPAAIATVSGTNMLLRETADHPAASAVERYAAGTRVPMLTTAAGRVQLAFCPAPQRELLLSLLARSNKEDDKPARNTAEVLALLTEARTQGFATSVHARRASDEASLAVPVLQGAGVLAILSVRFSGTAVPVKTAIERFVPKMREAAQKIGAAYALQSSTNDTLRQSGNQT
jgi:IclR family transcriptional regulator, mhp operon transcriptional activator